jgi:transcription elongation factor
MSDQSANPVLPRTPIELSGQNYDICFTFDALRIAESELRKVGAKANLLHALDLSNMDATGLVSLLYAGMLTFQPDTTPAEAANLVTMRNMGQLFEGIAAAYAASLADPEPDAEAAPSDPTPPGN